jgi:hypothetical protein
MLSWGKTPILTDFFIDYIPMYNKFRAVSSIQVILELCFPVLAIMGLQSFFKLKELQWKALNNCLCSIRTYYSFVFKQGHVQFSVNDDYYLDSYGPEFIEALKGDRMSLYSADLLRSGFYWCLEHYGCL